MEKSQTQQSLVPSISIIGNGAMGNLLALRCKQIDLNYQLCTRDGSSIKLDVTDFSGKKQLLAPHVTSTANFHQSKLIIVPLKAYQIIPFLEKSSDKIARGQTILLLHNGMGTIEAAKRLLPNNPILFATTSHAAYKPDAQALIETGRGHSSIGIVQNPLQLSMADVTATCVRLLSPCAWSEQIELTLWNKLAVNAVINPLTAIHRVNNGALMQNRFKQVKEAICNEIAGVMAALNLQTSAEQLLEKVETVVQATAGNFSSMNRDIELGRRTEIDYINGYVVTKGQQVGINTGQNTALLRQVKALEHRTIQHQVT